MKHWQFYLAILLLILLLLPIYEGLETKTISNLPTGTYVIRTASGKGCHYNKTIDCNDETETKFYITNLGNGGMYENKHRYGPGSYSIQLDKKYCADDIHYKNTENVTCHRTWFNLWETFKIIDIGDGFYNIIGGRQKKYCTIENGQMKCTKSKAGENEKFKIIPFSDSAESGSELETAVMPLEAAIYNIKNKEFPEINDSMKNLNAVLPNLETQSFQSENELAKLASKYPILEKRQGELVNNVEHSDRAMMDGLGMLSDINGMIVGLDGRLMESENKEAEIRNNIVPALNKRTRELSDRLDNIETKRQPDLYDRTKKAQEEINKINSENKTNFETLKHNKEVWNL
jgi:hypothetical protein